MLLIRISYATHVLIVDACFVSFTFKFALQDQNRPIWIFWGAFMIYIVVVFTKVTPQLWQLVLSFLNS